VPSPRHAQGMRHAELYTKDGRTRASGYERPCGGYGQPQGRCPSMRSSRGHRTLSLGKHAAMVDDEHAAWVWLLWDTVLPRLSTRLVQGGGLGVAGMDENNASAEERSERANMSEVTYACQMPSPTMLRSSTIPSWPPGPSSRARILPFSDQLARRSECSAAAPRREPSSEAA
jgi:hypothetical protein